MGLYLRAEMLCCVTEIGLEVSAEKTKYVVMNRDQNAERSHSMKTENRSFDRAEVFKFRKKLRGD